MQSQRPTPDERPAKAGPFQTRMFLRMLGLVWMFRTTLLAGLAATVVFAGLHTLGIGWAFPVFKVLLEPEGLRGWVDRSAAGRRLDLEFAATTERSQIRLRVVRVPSDGAPYAFGLRPFDLIWDPDERPAAELLHDLAHAPPGAGVGVLAELANDDSAAEPRTLVLTPAESDFVTRLLQRTAGFAVADTPQAKLRTLVYLLVGLVLTVLIANVFSYFGKILVAKAVLRAMMNLRGRLYAHTLRLPMSYFAGEPASQLVTRFVQDIQEVQRGLTTLLGRFVREPLRALFTLGLAFALDWRITLGVVIVAPFAAVVFMVVGRRVKRVNRKLLQTYGVMVGALTNTLQNLRMVKAYTAEEHERVRLAAVDRAMLRRQMKLVKLEAFVGPTMETIALLAGSLVTVWLASRVLNQELSVAKFVTLGFILAVLFDPIRKLSDVFVRVQRATAGAERVFELLDLPLEGSHYEASLKLAPLRETIKLENVSFTYPGSETPALRDVNLTIRQGETVAIVGPNGSGKTTLVSLLPRLYEIDAGRILYDGVDIRDATLESLRAQIGLVSQEAIVFGGTPIENIAYGEQPPDLERVRDAARRASADEFIRALPGQYEAVLGERGTTLSGGQRQRLAIARGIYRDAPILIFDEATSNIDSESEHQIQAALRAVAEGRTMIIIAHRLSTIQFADRVIVMDAGRIVDSGTHAELFERCPLYHGLYEKQLVRQLT